MALTGSPKNGKGNKDKFAPLFDVDFNCTPYVCFPIIQMYVLYFHKRNDQWVSVPIALKGMNQEKNNVLDAHVSKFVSTPIE